MAGPATFQTVLDLVGAQVWPNGQKGKGEPPPSPFPDELAAMSAYLPTLLDNLTTSSSKVIVGRVNINQASRVVLSCLPGMTDEIVAGILAQRSEDPAEGDENQDYETWLLTQGLVTKSQMKALFPYVTTGGSVFRAQSYGSFDSGGPTARVEAVLDATQTPPGIVFWREMTHLGRGLGSSTLLGGESSQLQP